MVSLSRNFGKLVMLGADVVGLNYHLGPYHMIQSLKQSHFLPSLICRFIQMRAYYHC